MCVIAFAWNAHPRWPLVLIGNRDEFHARPATAAGVEPDAPLVYGGRDLEKQGGWLQVSRARRLATVTNVRVGGMPETSLQSRGALVADHVRASSTNAEWLAQLAPRAAGFGRFNLLLWDGDSLALAGNHPHFAQRRVSPGVHGVSNGALDEPWPKVRHVQAALAQWLAGSPSPDALAPLFAALADQRIAPDDELPDTGVGLELERLLSPAFVRGERYGTRCSSVVLVAHDGVVFAERRFGPHGVVAGESTAHLPLA
jgi:uncharacterized protein with NRDE domain